MKERQQLFEEAMNQIQMPDEYQRTILFHHVFSLKLGEDYIINDLNQLKGLVNFFNISKQKA